MRVLVLVKEVVDPSSELLGTHEVLQHPEHTGTFTIGYSVKQLGDLIWISDFLDNGMAVQLSVQIHHILKINVEKLSFHLPVWVIVSHSLVLHVAGEPLVKPEIVPPLESDEVPEPHVGQLVGDHRGHPLLVGGGGGLVVV